MGRYRLVLSGLGQSFCVKSLIDFMQMMQKISGKKYFYYPEIRSDYWGEKAVGVTDMPLMN
jgi:hypothetical protein